jgi:hypothetical protein
VFNATGLAAGTYTVTYTYTDAMVVLHRMMLLLRLTPYRLLQLMIILYVQEAVWLFQDHLPAARGVAVI